MTPASLNDWILHLINGAAGESDVLDTTMRAAADDLIYLVLPFAAFLWFSPFQWSQRSENQRIVVTLAIAGVIALAASWIVGQFFSESRPFVADVRAIRLISHAPNNSFPSDHAAVAFAIAGALVWARRSVGAAVLVTATLVAVARVFVGVHWPADVLAGAMIGFAIGSIAALAAPLLIGPQSWLAKHLPAIVLESPHA